MEIFVVERRDEIERKRDGAVRSCRLAREADGDGRVRRCVFRSAINFGFHVAAAAEIDDLHVHGARRAVHAGCDVRKRTILNRSGKR